MRTSTRRFLPPSVLAALLASMQYFALPRQAMSEEQDDKPAKKITRGPAIDEEMLRPLLQGTWSWKLPKSDDGATKNVLVSFDGNLNVVGTARMTDGAALVISPGGKPVRITVTADAATGLNSPAAGSILKLPMPGIWNSPVRLLLKSATRKKLECVDLADTENPRKITITRTTDRLLKEIEGPGQPPITQAPAEPSQPTPPAAPAPLPPSPPPPTPAPEARKKHPEWSPLMSVFDRIKAEQAEKAAEAPATGAPPPKQVPESGSTSLRDVLTRSRRPALSLYERLKAEQAQTAAEPKPQQEPAKDTPGNEKAPSKSP